MPITEPTKSQKSIRAVLVAVAFVDYFGLGQVSEQPTINVCLIER